jgi:hypothetical protein
MRTDRQIDRHDEANRRFSRLMRTRLNTKVRLLSLHCLHSIFGFFSSGLLRSLSALNLHGERCFTLDLFMMETMYKQQWKSNTTDMYFLFMFYPTNVQVYVCRIEHK